MYVEDKPKRKDQIQPPNLWPFPLNFPEDENGF